MTTQQTQQNQAMNELQSTFPQWGTSLYILPRCSCHLCGFTFQNNTAKEVLLFVPMDEEPMKAKGG